VRAEPISKTMLRAIFYCAAVSLALTDVAAAQSDVKRAVLDFGLIGVWAAECDEPPSPTNNLATFALTSSGMVSLKYEFGGQYKPTRYTVVRARRIDAGRIEMREERLDVQPPYSLDVVLNKADGRIRVWSSVKSDGKVLVHDGHIVEVRDTKWLSRCR
jgi:hypothetical protein